MALAAKDDASLREMLLRVHAFMQWSGMQISAPKSATLSAHAGVLRATRFSVAGSVLPYMTDALPPPDGSITCYRYLGYELSWQLRTGHQQAALGAVYRSRLKAI